MEGKGGYWADSSCTCLLRQRDATVLHRLEHVEGGVGGEVGRVGARQDLQGLA